MTNPRDYEAAPDVPPEKRENFEKLVQLLEEWDPADVTHEVYGDGREYEGEAKRIIALAANTQSVEDLTEKIWRLFISQFNEEIAGPREAYEWLARRVLEE